MSNVKARTTKLKVEDSSKKLPDAMWGLWRGVVLEGDQIEREIENLTDENKKKPIPLRNSQLSSLPRDIRLWSDTHADLVRKPIFALRRHFFLWRWLARLRLNRRWGNVSRLSKLLYFYDLNYLSRNKPFILTSMISPRVYESLSHIKKLRKKRRFINRSLYKRIKRKMKAATKTRGRKKISKKKPPLDKELSVMMQRYLEINLETLLHEGQEFAFQDSKGIGLWKLKENHGDYSHYSAFFKEKLDEFKRFNQVMVQSKLKLIVDLSLNDLKDPALVICQFTDKVTTAFNQIEQAFKKLDKEKYALLLEPTGHSIFVQAKEDFYERLNQFLSDMYQFSNSDSKRWANAILIKALTLELAHLSQEGCLSTTAIDMLQRIQSVKNHSLLAQDNPLFLYEEVLSKLHPSLSRAYSAYKSAIEQSNGHRKILITDSHRSSIFKSLSTMIAKTKKSCSENFQAFPCCLAVEKALDELKEEWEKRFKASQPEQEKEHEMNSNGASTSVGNKLPSDVSEIIETSHAQQKKIEQLELAVVGQLDIKKLLGFKGQLGQLTSSIKEDRGLRKTTVLEKNSHYYRYYSSSFVYHITIKVFACLEALLEHALKYHSNDPRLCLPSDPMLFQNKLLKELMVPVLFFSDKGELIDTKEQGLLDVLENYKKAKARELFNLHPDKQQHDATCAAFAEAATQDYNEMLTNLLDSFRLDIVQGKKNKRHVYECKSSDGKEVSFLSVVTNMVYNRDFMWIEQLSKLVKTLQAKNIKLFKMNYSAIEGYKELLKHKEEAAKHKKEAAKHKKEAAKQKERADKLEEEKARMAELIADLEAKAEADEFNKKSLFLAKILPDDVRLVAATGKGDCFFESVAQCLNESRSKANYTAKRLRLLCSDYAKSNRPVWLQPAVEKTNQDFNQYLTRIQYTAKEMKRLNDDNTLIGLAISGQLEIEGRIIAEKLNVKIHAIECREAADDSPDLITHQLIDASGSKSLEQLGNDDVLYQQNNFLHIVVYKHHVSPVLKKVENVDSQQEGKEKVNVAADPLDASRQQKSSSNSPLKSSPSAEQLSKMGVYAARSDSTLSSTLAEDKNQEERTQKGSVANFSGNNK